jgi:hypothetical protein
VGLAILLPNVGAQLADNHDWIALAYARGYVLGQQTEAAHLDPGGVAVSPAAFGSDPWRTSQPERRHGSVASDFHLGSGIARDMYQCFHRLVLSLPEMRLRHQDVDGTSDRAVDAKSVDGASVRRPPVDRSADQLLDQDLRCQGHQPGESPADVVRLGERWTLRPTALVRLVRLLIVRPRWHRDRRRSRRQSGEKPLRWVLED